MEGCRARGLKPANDDEADAVAVLDYAAAVRGIKLPWGPGPLFATAEES